MMKIVLNIMICLFWQVINIYAQGQICDDSKAPLFTSSQISAYHGNCKKELTVISGTGGALFWEASIDPYVVNYKDSIQGGCNFQSNIWIENRSESYVEYKIVFMVETSANCGMNEESFKKSQKKIVSERRLGPKSKGHGERLGGKFHKIISVEVIYFRKIEEKPIPNNLEELTFPVTSEKKNKEPEKSDNDFAFIMTKQEKILKVYSDAAKRINDGLQVPNHKIVALTGTRGIKQQTSDVESRFDKILEEYKTGQNFTDCEKCHGMGVGLCSNCNGTVEKKCPKCDYEGFVKGGDGKMHPCKECHSGYTFCHCYCGIVVCSWCTYRGTGISIKQ